MKTPKDAAAAAAVSRLMERDKLDEPLGDRKLTWKKGQSLQVGGVTMKPYNSYGGSAAEKHDAKQQSRNTLMITPEDFEALKAVRDNDLRKGK